MGAGYRKSLNIGEHYSYSENLPQVFFLFRRAKENISLLTNNPIINFSFTTRHFAPKLLVFVVGEGMGLIVFIFMLIKEGKSILRTFRLDSIMLCNQGSWRFSGVEVFDPLCILHPPVTWIRVQCNKGKWDFHFLKFTCSRSIHGERFQLFIGSFLPFPQTHCIYIEYKR